MRLDVIQKVKLLGVVKADAYGHGAVRVAQHLEKIGASYLAVSNIDEMCRGAASAGVRILALTEHYDYDDRGGERHYGLRHARRMEEMKLAKAAWADRLELLCGEGRGDRPPERRLHE